MPGWIANNVPPLPVRYAVSPAWPHCERRWVVFFESSAHQAVALSENEGRRRPDLAFKATRVESVTVTIERAVNTLLSELSGSLSMSVQDVAQLHPRVDPALHQKLVLGATALDPSNDVSMGRRAACELFFGDKVMEGHY